VKVLDIFAGSGCIGISITCLPAGRCDNPNINVTFAEKEKNALAQIKINCRLNKLPTKRYRIIRSDVFKNVKGRFDYIFANPPYIPTTRKNKIQPSVLKYEPRAALFGGADGLTYIKKFLEAAKNFLNSGGIIYMEFDHIQQRAVKALAKKYGYRYCQIHKDQYGKPRWVVLQ
jgi:release factor glutamine methyltransferase